MERSDRHGPFASVVETHSGVVFFVGDRAYKLKKPVRFGFLDFSTRGARQAACLREVELNRRLAPDVYLGVADITGPDGTAVDHLVMMRRLPDERRLSTLVASGAHVEEHLWRLAHLLAAFHARADTSPAITETAGPDALRRRWEANATEMRRFAGTVIDAKTAERVTWLAGRYLDGRLPLFAARAADGRARDGHGDLLADDIFCLDDGPRVLDCLEFDDHLRWDDVVGDVAFLAMDLERLGRPDLAERFLYDYRDASGDNWPQSLADHHTAYRAHVRAKVACLRWEQGDEASAGEAARLLDLARAHLERGRVRLVLVGGLPGTGKSTLARGVGDALGAVVLRTDELRKERAGIGPGERAAAPLDEGIYRPAATADTYTALLGEARSCLGSGLSVVLDASWSDEAWRAQARRLAVDTAADVDELHCVVPAAVADRRLTDRAGRGDDASDATPAIAHAMAEVEAPWPTAVEVDTEPAPDVVLHSVVDLLTAA